MSTNWDLMADTPTVALAATPSPSDIPAWFGRKWKTEGLWCFHPLLEAAELGILHTEMCEIVLTAACGIRSIVVLSRNRPRTSEEIRCISEHMLTLHILDRSWRYHRRITHKNGDLE